MKTIKTKMFLLTILLSAGIAAGQEHKIPVQNTKEGKLILKNFTNDLPIEGYSGNEIIITSTSNDFSPPERAKGLRPIYPGGTDNSGLGLNVEKEGSVVTVICMLPIAKRADYKIRVPDNLSIEIESGCERSSNISIVGMKNEIDIQACHGIDLKNVTGPLVLSTISGDIDIVFSNMTPDKPMSINAISGEIDITLPSKTAVNLDLKTIGGSFYSDFEFTQTKDNLKRIGGNELGYALNGGGPKFSIATVSGNVYIRKGN
jgi:hypothetical protein